MTTDTATQIRVRIENTYECGRESSAEVEVAAPPLTVLTAAGDVDEEVLDRWYDDVVAEHTGDGHPCGEREHALYEATVIAAPPGLDRLLGHTVGSEG